MNGINEKTTIQFSEDFFDEEIRCGYRVTSKTKKVWAIELDLLSELIRVCKKHNIKLFVFGGTLLGTIRHKGFIPWDDDIDVCLVRSEYEKLLEVAPNEFHHPYFFQTALSDRRYFIGFARLRNSLTTGQITGKESKDYNQGIYIDIFVLDGYIDNPKLLHRQLLKKSFLLQLISSYQMNISSNNKLKYYAKRCLGRILSFTFCRLISYEKTVRWYEINQKRFNKEAIRVTLLTHEMPFITKYWCEKRDLEHCIEMPFENIMVPVPHNYHSMLEHMYGNYMEYPSLEKRGMWHHGKIEFDPDTPYLEKL